MSSLQKFHRRTLVVGGGATWPATAIGGGDITYGFWLGTAGDGTSKLIAAPKLTEVTGLNSIWGSNGVLRNITSTTNGVANTNTLASFGSSTASGHPGASYCKSLSTGGYTTWYLPAKDELMTLYSNKSAVPFATADSFIAFIYWSSTENNATLAWRQNMSTGAQGSTDKTYSGFYVRAVRRSTI